MTAAVSGCGGGKNENALGSINSQNHLPQQEETKQESAAPSPEAPNEFPVLDNAQNVTSSQTGPGIHKGERYYHIRYNVDESIEETGERYRQILKDQGLEIIEQDLEAGGGAQMYKVNTKSWQVTLTILTLEQTTVWINYAKK
ncbi:hypothetical protein D7Z26_10780 [Cohnella endophytica]|uniref:Uncharacterized protein n=2 Tax=Cohnella endophytica TaxID=2419778 RepID=A0A494XT93_9BACL|nr:hypothetical protein D7Z26_10780 [Cohnella endophytica]